MSLHKHTISFRHAFDGVQWALQTQPNFRIHFLLATIALLAAYIYKITYPEFLVIVVLIVVGLVIETLNTALEKVSDAISKDYHEDIKIAKDLGAGAMLIFAIGATLIAAIIFLPRIF